MTVRVTKEDRKRIDHIKEGGGYMPARIAKELVLDDSYRDINKRGYIYESPDGGKTIYRRAASYCDVSGVKIDKSEQLELNFNKLEEQLKENDINARMTEMENKISQVATLMDEITEGIKKLRDNN